VSADGGRVRRALEGDSSLVVTRSVLLDDIHIRADGKGRTVVAYATVWNVPTEIDDTDGHYREQNAPESMTKSVRERAGRIFSVYNHAKTLSGTPSDQWSVPLGKPTLIQPDRTGLLTHTLYNSDPEADRVLEAVRSGSLTGMSYTGVFLESDPPLPRYGRYGPGGDGVLPLVTRQQIALIEYGPTPIPAYEDAVILGVRSRRTRMDDDDAQPDQQGRETIVLATPPVEPAGGAQRAAMDMAAWDGEAAMAACADAEDPAVAYAEVCAGQSGGDPAQRASWALPHHPGPGEPAHPDAVRVALDQVSQMQLADPEAARAHLQAHLADMAPDSTSSSGRDPAPAAQRAEPQQHPAPKTTRSGTMPDTDRETMTVEERVARQSEIRARLTEIDTEYSGAELTVEARSEWRSLQNELTEHDRAIDDASERAAYLRQINDEHPEHTERVDNSRAGFAPAGGGSRYGQAGPAFHPRENIYDLPAIRNRARNLDEVPVLYREYAQRAVEQARYPGATGVRGAPSKEEAQQRVAALLDTIDDENGTLARRILVTGSPLYDRAFGKMLGMQSTAGLTAEESRALSLGTDSAGGYAVPFQLDPTVILTSNGVVNPLRQISRVETITGKEWDGVTSAGVTVSRGTEGQEQGTGDPAFIQPSVRTTRVQGFIPFSIELDVSWGALRTQMTNLLMDAKDVEEATAFATGNGTAPNPSGIVATLGTASYVQTAGSGVLAAGDVYLLENAMAPRFIANSAIVASKTIFNKFRALFQAQASAAGDPFARPSGSMGAQFNGYPKYELSTMSTTNGTGNLVMLQGDFSRFLIVDRVGMGIELIPHLFGSANRYPTGQRGVLAIWFNSSKVLADNAFRMLQVKST
jgi:HK97 family phage major capsid protein